MFLKVKKCFSFCSFSSSNQSIAIEDNNSNSSSIKHAGNFCLFLFFSFQFCILLKSNHYFSVVGESNADRCLSRDFASIEFESCVGNRIEWLNIFVVFFDYLNHFETCSVVIARTESISIIDVDCRLCCIAIVITAIIVKCISTIEWLTIFKRIFIAIIVNAFVIIFFLIVDFVNFIITRCIVVLVSSTNRFVSSLNYFITNYKFIKNDLDRVRFEFAVRAMRIAVQQHHPNSAFRRVM